MAFLRTLVFHPGRNIDEFTTSMVQPPWPTTGKSSQRVDLCAALTAEEMAPMVCLIWAKRKGVATLSLWAVVPVEGVAAEE